MGAGPRSGSGWSFHKDGRRMLFCFWFLPPRLFVVTQTPPLALASGQMHWG